MVKEELEKEARKYADAIERKASREIVRITYIDAAESREKRIEELEAQIKKLIDFVLQKVECCDICPITDTCINSEGTCSYTGILAKGEGEVTREWLIQFISSRRK